MCTSITNSGLPPAKSEIPYSLQKQAQASTNLLNKPIFFNNSKIPKESIFTKICTYFLKEDCLTQDKWQHKPLPPLGVEQLIEINKILTAQREIIFDGLKINFTLSQLFNYLLSKNDPQTTAHIANIELVGGAVPWVLGNYLSTFLKDFEIENPNEWLSEELLQEYAHPPKDFDFRIFAPKATVNDIETLKKSIFDFLVDAGAQQNPSYEKKELRQLLSMHGFTNYTKPKNLDQSLFSTIGFGDVDVVIYQKLPRESLFVSDSLFLPIMDVLNADSMVNHAITPRSNLKNGCDAIFDRLSGIIRALDPQTINCAGWPCLLINYLKGKRCLTSSLEATLLNKTICTLKGSYATTDCPQELFNLLRGLEKAGDSKRKACVISFWLKKSIASHLRNDPSAALILTLQACLSLKTNNADAVIPELWIAMKPSTKGSESNPLLAQIAEIMDNGAGSFESLLAFLQVKAFLYLIAAEKDPNFSSQLIMHQGLPAIQAKFDSYTFLLPYAPSKAIFELKTPGEPLPAFEKLDSLLQPKNSYVKQENIPDWTPFIWGIKRDFSKPWDKVAAEWFIASEIQHPTPHGSKLIEDFLPDLLSHMDKNQVERLLQSVSISLEKRKLFNNIRLACSGKAYASIPMPLIVAISLAAVGDPASAYKAYNLWKTNFTALPVDVSGGFTRTFIQQLSNSRPDLAIDVLSHFLEANPSFQHADACLNNTLNSTHRFYITKSSVLQLTKAAKKAAPVNIAFIQRLISELISFKGECFEDIKSLWWIIYNETSDLESLKKPFFGHEELLTTLMDDETPYKKIENSFVVLSSLKSTKTTQWKNLLNQIHHSKNKELCQKVWDYFLSILESPQKLKGTPQEKGEVYLCIIKMMANKNPSALFDLLNKEHSLISFYNNSQNELFHHTAHVVFNALLEACENHCPPEKLEKILKLRQELATACQAPLGVSIEWKQSDLIFVEKLALSPSTYFKIVALETYIAQNDVKESVKTLLFLLNNEISKKDTLFFIQTLLSFLSQLPAEKHELLLKILQTPQIGKFLQNAPFQSFHILKGWVKKTGSMKEIPVKFVSSCLKQLHNLIPQVDASFLWSPDFIHTLEYLIQNPLKSEELFNKAYDLLSDPKRVWSSAEIEKILPFLDQYLKAPSNLILEIGTLNCIELLTHQQDSANTDQKKHILLCLREFLELALKYNCIFTSRFFERTTQHPLPDSITQFCQNTPSLLLDLITINHQYLLSLENTSQKCNRNKEIIKLLGLVKLYLPFIAKDENMARICMNIATQQHVQYLKDNSNMTIEEEEQIYKLVISLFHVNENIHNEFLEVLFNRLELTLQQNPMEFYKEYSLNRGIKLNTQTISLYIQKLLSLKLCNLESFNQVSKAIHQELNIQINNNINAEDLKKNLHDFVFYPYNIGDEVANSSDSDHVFSIWSNHLARVIDVVKNAKHLLSAYPNTLYQYICLRTLTTEDISFSLNLSNDQMDKTIEKLIHKINVPTFFGALGLLNLAHNKNLNNQLTPPRITDLWNIAIKTSAKLKKLDCALSCFHSKGYINPVHTPAWEKSSVDICEAFFFEICSSKPVFENEKTTLTPLEICNRSSSFLKIAWGHDIFSNQVDRYYGMLDKLMILIAPTGTSTEDYYEAVDSQINDLIRLPAGEVHLFRKAVLKWSDLLSASFEF